MTKAIVFDMDGTLIDTEKFLVEGRVKAMHALGYHDFTWEDSLYFRSLPPEEVERILKERYGEGFPYMSVRLKRREMAKRLHEEFGFDKKKGSDKALKVLKEREYKIAVATASDYERAKRYLQKVGLFEYFEPENIICATELEHGKPYPDVYLYACRQLGERPEECIAVEDGPFGVMSAYRAGMQVIMVPDLTQPEEEVRKMLYKKIDGLEDLIDLFQ